MSHRLPEAPWSKQNPGPPPIVYKPMLTRVQEALNRVTERMRTAEKKKAMTPEDRKRVAAEMREQAARIERGT